MNKKLLLSTVLTSALLASTGTKAAVHEFTYDGNNTFTLGGNQYIGFEVLGTHIMTPGNFDLNNDRIKMSTATQRAFLDAMKVDGSAERTSFARAIAAGGVDFNEAQEGVNEAMAYLSQIEDNLGVNLLDSVDLNDLFVADLEEIKENVKYFQAYIDAHETMKTSDLKFESLASKLAESDAEIKTLVDEKNALAAIANKTEAQNARLIELSNKIASSDGFNEFRTSPEAQESLKKNIELIKAALEANDNSTLLAKVELDLEAFINEEASKYLVLNPKATDKLPAVQQSDNAAAESILESMLANRTVLDSRIGSLGGVASGDMMETYGAWAKGSFTQATQKAYGGSQGYKLDSKRYYSWY